MEMMSVLIGVLGVIGVSGVVLLYLWVVYNRRQIGKKNDKRNS